MTKINKAIKDIEASELVSNAVSDNPTNVDYKDALIADYENTLTEIGKLLSKYPVMEVD